MEDVAIGWQKQILSTCNTKGAVRDRLQEMIHAPAGRFVGRRYLHRSDQLRFHITYLCPCVCIYYEEIIKRNASLESSPPPSDTKENLCWLFSSFFHRNAFPARLPPPVTEQESLHGVSAKSKPSLSCGTLHLNSWLLASITRLHTGGLPWEV